MHDLGFAGQQFRSTEGNEINLKDFTPQMAHWVREAWRRKQWHIWATAKRRDNHLVTDDTYDEEICLRTRKLYMETDIHGKKVLMAAAVSPAAWAVMRKEPVPLACPFCEGDLVPDWHHCVWTCPAFAHTRQNMEAPAAQMQARNGWACTTDRGRNMKVLAHMAVVRETILALRYRR